MDENCADVVDVVLKSGGVNEEVINVCYNKLVYNVLEDLVDEGLKNSWRIGETLGHIHSDLTWCGRLSSIHPPL